MTGSPPSNLPETAGHLVFTVRIGLNPCSLIWTGGSPDQLSVGLRTS